ncbi:MAG: NAD(P)H-quinone oxidoreductase [Pseudolabrys sp.]|nr:NAD(P)H-quinone oxidoreductase [Pseudolabrys sp.]
MSSSQSVMRVVIPSAPGGPDVLTVEQRPIPSPGPSQVLIRVAFAGINRHDAGQRTRGNPPANATDVLGLEVSGEIVAVGDNVQASRIGEKVCALVNGGGYATHCLAYAGLALPQPPGLTEKESASIPEALITVWFNLVEIGGLKRDDWLLVHGGAGGIGSFAIQVGKALGCKVVTTASTDEKCEACKKLGADVVVNYKKEDFVTAVNTATSSRGVDIILDIAGGLYAERNLAALAPDGHILHLSSGGYDAVFSAPLRLIMAKRARITGSLLRPLPAQRQIALAEKVHARLWPLLGREIHPIIDSTYRLDDVRDAHRRLDANLQIGKILLDAR